MIVRGPNSCLLDHVTGILLCLYVKLFLPSIFNSLDISSSMTLIVLDIELTEKTIFKKLGLVIDGSLQGLSFCPPETYKPNKRTTWNTSHTHGNAWSSGKPEYEKLFAVFYVKNVTNAQVFAEGFEKCRPLTRLLEQNAENLDNYGCPKFQDLVGERKTDSSWICSSYLFLHKTRLHYAERKAKVYGEWAMQHL